MAVFTEGLFNDPLTQDDLEPTGGERRRAVIGEAWSSMVGPSLYRMAELDEAKKWGGMAFPEYSPDQAREWIAGQGLDGHLTPENRTYNQLELSILARRKKAELQRQYVLERASGGFAQGSERLLLSLGTSLADPLTVASAFVPVVGEARYASLLAKATGGLGRAGVRAGLGAIEGTVGAALVEPIIYAAKQQEQADYDAYDSLANIAFGGIFGGGLHAVGGAVVDYRTGRRERALDELLGKLDRLDAERARVATPQRVITPETSETVSTALDALYTGRRTKLEEQAAGRLDEQARVTAETRLADARAAITENIPAERALYLQRVIEENETALKAHELAAAAQRDLDRLGSKWERATTLNERADLLGVNFKDRLFEAQTLDAVTAVEQRVADLNAERAEIEARRQALSQEQVDPDSPLAAARAEANQAELRSIDNRLSLKAEQIESLTQLARDWRGQAVQSAAGRAAAAQPQTREAALRAAVANDLNGDPVNVEAVFELDAATRTKPIDQTLAQLRRGDTPPAAAADEIIEATEESAITEQLADLEQSLKDLEREVTLDETALPDDIRAEIDEAKAFEQEAGTMAQTARTLAACAMRATT